MEPQRRAGAPGAQVIVISGPSGVGKDTIINELRRRPVGQTFHYVVTCTTRPPRTGEMDGVHYHFQSRESFDALNAAGELLEAATVHDRSYGTPRDEVRGALARGVDALCKIDVQGAEMQVLDGGWQLIKTQHPALFIECDDSALQGFGSSAAALIHRMSEAGYRIHEVGHAGISTVLTPEQALARQVAGSYTDFLFL